MVQTKSAAGKKRAANSKLQRKPAKTLKTQPVEEQVEEKQEEGLFDNLDEEMDPNELENIVNNLNEESGSEEELEEEEDQDIEEAEQEADEEEQDDEMAEDETEEKAVEEEEETPVLSKQQTTAKKFRDLYMTKVTQAFGSDLDQIRHEPNLSGPRLNILIDSLEAGIDIFSNLEQEIILADEEQ